MADSNITMSSSDVYVDGAPTVLNANTSVPMESDPLSISIPSSSVTIHTSQNVTDVEPVTANAASSNNTTSMPVSSLSSQQNTTTTPVPITPYYSQSYSSISKNSSISTSSLPSITSAISITPASSKNSTSSSTSITSSLFSSSYLTSVTSSYNTTSNIIPFSTSKSTETYISSQSTSFSISSESSVQISSSSSSSSSPSSSPSSSSALSSSSSSSSNTESSSSSTPIISSTVSKNYIIYIYDQKFEFTDASTTFDTDIPVETRIKITPNKMVSFTPPTGILTTDAALYQKYLAGTLDWNSHDTDARIRNSKIIGGVVGSICGLLVCSVVIFLLFFRRKRNTHNYMPDDDLTSIKDEKGSYYGFSTENTPYKPAISTRDLTASNQRLKKLFSKKENSTPTKNWKKATTEYMSTPSTNPFQDEFDFDKRLPSPPNLDNKGMTPSDKIINPRIGENDVSIPHLLLPDNESISLISEPEIEQSTNTDTNEQFSYVSSMNSYGPGSSFVPSSVGDYSTLSPTSIHIDEDGSIL
ncbi:Topoisomerase I damage affected protein 7 [Nakaseomyces glabratus]|nr:Topoisomerase I damage affected protein 7 [Nakaseomyces glabratus]KTB24349.1 Topoisomerase I damage affected protein 7 [Nakaseomyces glabratus]